MIRNHTLGAVSKFALVSQLFDASGTFSVPYSGTYRITAIGHGANGWSYNNEVYSNNGRVDSYSGGCGGGGLLEIKLSAGEQLEITISDSESTVSKSGTTLISATAGSKSVAGSVSGSNVVAFASNGTETSSITPPDCYNSPLYISKGGRPGVSGYSGSSSDPLREEVRGGSGLFGGDGGDGGDVVCGQVSGGYSYDVIDPETADNGGGNGGAAYCYTSRSAYHGGGGGGGGYGGGGGPNRGNCYFSYVHYFYKSTPGYGAAGCVFIERIG